MKIFLSILLALLLVGIFVTINSIYTLAIGFNINSFNGGGCSQTNIFYT